MGVERGGIKRGGKKETRRGNPCPRGREGEEPPKQGLGGEILRVAPTGKRS